MNILIFIAPTNTLHLCVLEWITRGFKGVWRLQCLQLCRSGFTSLLHFSPHDSISHMSNSPTRWSSPSAPITPRFTLVNVAVWLSWKPERHLQPRPRPCAPCACADKELAVCYGVPLPLANHRALFVLKRPPMAVGSPAAGEENETLKLNLRREKRLRGKR